jgi:DNA repair protein RadD
MIIPESVPMAFNLDGGRYQLRDYQKQAVSAAKWYFDNDKLTGGSLMVLPTGSGKSLILAAAAKELGAPVLIFQPSQEILLQNYDKFHSYGYTPAIFSASLNSKQIGGITLATIGSVHNRAGAFKHFKYIIIDEAHLVNSKAGMYQQFLDDHNGKILGLTATPYRLVTDGYGGSILKFLTRTRPRIFERVIHVTQIGDLFKAGYLAKMEYKQDAGFDSEQLRLNSTGADYTDESVRSYYQRTNFPDKLYATVINCLRAGRKNILVFTRFVEESDNLVKRLGPIAEIVTGETPKRDRDAIINRFRSGQTKVVSNVGVLSIGFDFPELETVILACPTMSLARYYQMAGRACRIHPNKQSTWVVDLCNNYKLFGRVEDLFLHAPKPGSWIITSNGRQLTNIYYGERNTAFQKKSGYHKTPQAKG